MVTAERSPVIQRIKPEGFIALNAFVKFVKDTYSRDAELTPKERSELYSVDSVVYRLGHYGEGFRLWFNEKTQKYNISTHNLFAVPTSEVSPAIVAGLISSSTLDEHESRVNKEKITKGEEIVLVPGREMMLSR